MIYGNLCRIARTYSRACTRVCIKIIYEGVMLSHMNVSLNLLLEDIMFIKLYGILLYMKLVNSHGRAASILTIETFITATI